jgi:hypothetical protein
MLNKRNGLILTVIGAIVVIFALLAHTIGIGHSGFGVKHIAVLVGGIVLLVAGGVIVWRSQAPGAPPAASASGAQAEPPAS